METTHIDFLTNYQRIHSLPVKVGNIIIGDNQPIRIQSMTNTDTLETEKTVAQIRSLVEAGCEIVRLTVPNLKAAQNLEAIKSQLVKYNCLVPLVADIHFTPQAANVAAGIIEKVRINPGNFVDRKHFKEREYSEQEYQDEIKRVEDKFIPLIEICKANNTAMRIGCNHGSLSDRIINHYGDSPEGMVQSVLEFLNICESEGFDQIVFSMKSSNTLVMVAAYRLLATRLKERGKIYPFHLGVTEAGDGEDGRAKSGLGIGSLLMDGIGDTIRVSLTEDPEKEVPVAQKIVSIVNSFLPHKLPVEGMNNNLVNNKFPINYYSFERQKTHPIKNFGNQQPIQVVYSSNKKLAKKEDLQSIGITQIATTDKWKSSLHSPDFLYLKNLPPVIESLREASQNLLLDYSLLQSQGIINNSNKNIFFNSLKEFLDVALNNASLQLDDSVIIVKINYLDYDLIEKTFNQKATIFNRIVFLIDVCENQSTKHNPSWEIRNFIFQLKNLAIKQPLILSLNHLYRLGFDFQDEEIKQIAIAIYSGHLLVDGLIDGIWLENGEENDLLYLFSTLQASRQRISKPEYISCPSCGRTLFDLQEVTAKVKEATNHLVGVKIAIMGCIVNGPGEMADADFGYVGSGHGKITLYKGKKVKVRSIPSNQAVEKLVDLIKEEGYWKEKKEL